MAMSPLFMRGRAMAAGAVLSTCAACAPVLSSVYVGDATQGEVVHSTCALNKHVPQALAIDRQGIHALVSLYERGPWHYVEARFDVPPGLTLALQDDKVRIDGRDGSAARVATIPNVSQVDAPSINSYNDAPAMRALMLPVLAPLPGGRVGLGSVMSDRHYWTVARFDGALADDVAITLPPMTVDGKPLDLPPLRFHRDRIVIVALINC